MADLNDVELVAELKSYGENVSLPIKAKNRPILVKKLNHLRVRRKKEDVESTQINSKPTHRRSKGPPTPTPSSSRRASGRYRLNQADESPSNLDALSSDDSDMEVNVRPLDTRMASSTVASKPHSSSFTDSVLRTIRRRTTDYPSPRLRSGRRSEVLELSTETNDSTADIDYAVLSNTSPGRNKLYPDLSGFSSSLRSKSADNFESSDSDGDVSTYSVDNKSMNTSFPSFHNNRNHQGGSSSASSFSNAGPSYESPVPLHKSLYARRYQMNGPGSPSHRVLPYRSRFSENLPLLLIVIVAVFFGGLFLTYYVVMNKDFIFSWFSTSVNMGSHDTFLHCKDGDPLSDNCFSPEEINKAMGYVKDLHGQLSAKKGAVVCNIAKQGDDLMKAGMFRTQLSRDYKTEKTTERMYRCSLLHILANPHWDLLLLKSDGSESTKPDDVATLESKMAVMTFWCRLHRSFTQVVYGVIYMVVGVFCAMLLYMYMKHYMKRRSQEQRDIYVMVEKIIDVLQEHHEQFRRDDSDESPYLAVQHVRDQLLPPAQRRQYQDIWDKAVEFISANESRIRMESKIIRGEQFDVWYWLQPVTHNGKVWQGQAFGENDNNSNQIMYCPSPCLKIRNMFDSNVENDEDNWEEGVIDAVLEKCGSIATILHVYVDVDSKEGCVYMKCSTCEEAGKARSALNGWWFDGRLVTVKHLKTDHYHKRWPEAKTASKPLKPSTNQMRSLSQPFYRSSLETT